MYHDLKKLHLTDKQILELQKIFEDANQRMLVESWVEGEDEHDFCYWVKQQIYQKEHRFVPKINCGNYAGSYPMYFLCTHKDYFMTREECDKWIQDHQDDFSANEISGGVYTEEMII